MRKTFFLTTFFLALGFVIAVQAQSPALPVVTTQDLETAGYTSVTLPEQEGSRYAPPVYYFRVTESLSASNASKDCNDCGNLVAVHLAETSAVPHWFSDSSNALRLVGGRVQARRYHPATKVTLIVTGPELEKVSALSDLLLTRIAQAE